MHGTMYLSVSGTYFLSPQHQMWPLGEKKRKKEKNESKRLIGLNLAILFWENGHTQ